MQLFSDHPLRARNVKEEAKKVKKSMSDHSFVYSWILRSLSLRSFTPFTINRFQMIFHETDEQYKKQSLMYIIQFL